MPIEHIMCILLSASTKETISTRSRRNKSL